MKALIKITNWNLALLLAFVAATLTGCGGKDDANKDGDKKAKAKDKKELLIGKWELDMDETTKESNAKDEPSKMMLKMMRDRGKTDDKMVMEFKSDGTASMTMSGTEPDTGKYEVEDKGDHLVVKILDAKKAPPGDAIIHFENDDLFTMQNPEDKMMPFKKMFFKRVQ